MTVSLARSCALVAAMIALPMLLAGCSTAPPLKPAAKAPVLPAAAAPPPPRVMPVEAEPAAPATLPALSYNPAAGGPLAAMLVYADKLRWLPPPDIAAEISRLGDPGDSPSTQMQLALALAQTRAPADLARALGLLQRVASHPSPEAQPLQPLARALAARYQEQRRVEDDRERLAQQLRESQRRIEQLNDRIEALRAIERSFSRPNAAPAAPMQPGSPAAPRAVP